MKTVYFDTETAGLLETHPIIQLAAVAIDDATWEECASFNTKILFDESAADPEALKLNHYDARVWKVEGVSVDTAVYQFSDFLRPFCCLRMVSKRTGNPYFVAKLNGYNAATFDGPRLKAMYAKTFLPADPRIRCTLQRALAWFDERGIELENYRLETVCRYFGIDIEGAHDALADVRATVKLARRLRDNSLPEPDDYSLDRAERAGIPV